MFQLGLADNCFEAVYVQLAMMQSVFHAYTASSQLVISIKYMFIVSPNEECYANWHGKSIPA